jgi:hypothetical protein
MIPLRLELRTACVLDRSDNQLHHRTMDVKLCFKGNYNPYKKRLHGTNLLRPHVRPDGVDHLSRTASRISPGLDLTLIAPNHLCHAVQRFHREFHTDDMFLRHCDQHASILEGDLHLPV